MVEPSLGGGFVGESRNQKTHLGPGRRWSNFGHRLGRAFTLVFRESLGLGDDEKVAGGANIRIEEDGRF